MPVRLPEITPELKRLGVLLVRRMTFVAIMWTTLYFAMQWAATGPAMLVNLLVGSLAGVVIGWQMSDNAVQEIGLTGLLLTIVLVLACWIPMWALQSLWASLMSHFAGWKMTFGRWMLLSSSTILSMATAAWRLSVDD